MERLTDEIQQVDQKVAVTRRPVATLARRRRGPGHRRVGRSRLRRLAATGRTPGPAGRTSKAAGGTRKQQAERDKQERERIAAEAARKEAQTIQQVQQEFAERFLQQLLTNKEITAEDARQRALKELPALVKLPLAEIQSLIDRKIAPRATEKSLSSLDRARAALAKGNYDEVFQAADEQKQQGRELAMLEGTRPWPGSAVAQAGMERPRPRRVPAGHGPGRPEFPDGMASLDRRRGLGRFGVA